MPERGVFDTRLAYCDWRGSATRIGTAGVKKLGKVARPAVPDDQNALVKSALAREFDGLMGAAMAPGLYVVATPIGHLGDVSLRSLAILCKADHVYCEDTRHSRVLLTRFGISRALASYHDHSTPGVRAAIIARLKAGKTVALISDAGTPLISDPGFKLVRAALDAAVQVFAIPGPSAVLAALTSSGLATDSFFFAGFLPTRAAVRRARLSELAGVPATLVVFETAKRLAVTLADLARSLGARQAVVAREITKLNEDVQFGDLQELSKSFADAPVRGEMVIVIGPPEKQAVDEASLEARLGAVLETMSVKDAVRHVAAETGASRSRVYELALKVQRRQED